MNRLPILLGTCFLLGGCGWTVEEARKAAFHDVRPFIDTAVYSQQDPHFFEHQQAIQKGQQRVGDRFVTNEPSLPGYLVSELNKTGLPSKTMFYTDNGRLVAVRLFSGNDFPRVGYVYCATEECPGKKEGEIFKKGQLKFVSFFPVDREVFYFSDNGELSFHEKY